MELELQNKTPEQEVIIIRPWVRYFARLLDWQIWGAALGFALGFTFSSLVVEINDYVLGMVAILTWIPLEAFFVSNFNTTPGKWLLGTYVKTVNGERPSYKQAIRRSLLVSLYGYALGVPIVSLFFLWNSYLKLKREGASFWDTHSGTVVVHEKVGILKGLMVFLFILALGFLIYL